MNKTQIRVLVISWVTYATFYFLRVNFSIAIPGMMEEFGFTKVQLGGALSAFFAMYAIGQFISGQLADNLGPKKMVAIGLVSSIVISLLIPSSAIYILLIGILWGVNGFVQSMGWSPNVKIVSAWFSDEQKGRASGILGTSYIVGGALSWVLAGYLAKIGWRAVFYGPTVFAFIVLLLWLIFAKENPTGTKSTVDFKTTIPSVLKDKRVWLAGIGLFGLNIVRYGFLNWAPTYFFEVEQANRTTATYRALIFPLAGALGALSIGWFSDKLFKNNRTLVGLIYSIILIAALIGFVNNSDWRIGLVLLAIIGFTTFGPHMLLVTELPMIFGNNKNTASIVGFIDGIGYIGASITGVATGWLIDSFSWNHAFYFWVLGAMIAGLFIFLSSRGHSSIVESDKVSEERR